MRKNYSTTEIVIGLQMFEDLLSKVDGRLHDTIRRHLRKYNPKLRELGFLMTTGHETFLYEQRLARKIRKALLEQTRIFAPVHRFGRWMICPGKVVGLHMNPRLAAVRLDYDHVGDDAHLVRFEAIDLEVDRDYFVKISPMGYDHWIPTNFMERQTFEMMMKFSHIGLPRVMNGRRRKTCSLGISVPKAQKYRLDPTEEI